MYVLIDTITNLIIHTANSLQEAENARVDIEIKDFDKAYDEFGFFTVHIPRKITIELASNVLI